MFNRMDNDHWSSFRPLACSDWWLVYKDTGTGGQIQGRFRRWSFICLSLLQKYSGSHLNFVAVGDRPPIPASLILLAVVGSHHLPKAGLLLLSKQNLLSTLREQQTTTFGSVLTNLWSESSYTRWVGCLQIRSQYLGLDFIYAGALQGWRWSIHGCNAAATNEQKGLRLASVRPSGARVVRPRVPLVVCFM